MSNKNKILKSLLASAVMVGSAGSAMATDYVVTTTDVAAWNANANQTLEDGTNGAVAMNTNLYTANGVAPAAAAPSVVYGNIKSAGPYSKVAVGAAGADVILTNADTVALSLGYAYTLDNGANGAVTLENIDATANVELTVLTNDLTVAKGITSNGGTATVNLKTADKKLILQGANSTANVNFAADSVLEIEDARNLTGTVDNTSGADNKGTLTLDGTHTITGAVGATKAVKLITAKGLAGKTVTFVENVTAETLNFSGDAQVKIADGKDLTAEVKTANTDNGQITFSGDSVITKEIGSDNALREVQLNAGAAKVVTAKADITATTVNFNNNADNVLALGYAANGKKITGNVDSANAGRGILNVFAGSHVTGTVGAVNDLKSVTFQEKGTFTVDSVTFKAPLAFQAFDSTLAYTNANSITHTGAVTTTGANLGSIEAKSLTAGQKLQIVGNVGANANSIKAIDVAGANLHLQGDAYVKDITAKEVTIDTANGATTNKFAYADGGQIVTTGANKTTFAEGSDLGDLSKLTLGDSVVELGKNVNLTVKDQLTNTNNNNGSLHFLDGNHTYDAVQQSGRNLASVKFTPATAGDALTIARAVEAAAIEHAGAVAGTINISNNVTGKIDAAVIDKLTVVFGNEKDSGVTVSGSVGETQALAQMKFGAGNVTFSDATNGLNATKLTFASDSNADVTVTANKVGLIADNTEITTTANGVGIIQIAPTNGTNIAFNKAGGGATIKTLGASDKMLKKVILDGTLNNTLNLNVATDGTEAYVQEIAPKTDKTVTVNYANKHTVLGLGNEKAQFKAVNFADDSTLKGAIYAEGINFNGAAKTYTVDTTGALNGKTTIAANSTILVKDGGAIGSDVYSTATTGIVTFEKGGAVTGKLGFDAANSLATVNFNGVKDEVVTISKDAFATDVNHTKGGTVQLAADVKLNGNYNITASALDLQTHTATVTGVTTIGAGESTITSKLAGQAGSVTGGKLVVDTAVAVAGATPTASIVIDASGENILPNASDSLQLISATNTADQPTADLIKLLQDKDITVVGSEFVKAKMDEKGKITFGRDLVSIVNLVKGADVAVRDGVKALADNADSATGDAQKIITNLGQMTNADQTEATERLFERTSSAAASQVTGAVGTAVGNRMSASSNSTFASTQGALEGVAAGDNMSSNMGAWASFVGQKGKQSKRKGEAGYDLDMQGGLVGFDTAVNDTTVVGAAVAMSNTTLKHKDDKKGDKVKAKTSMISVYGSKDFGSNWVGQAMAMFGSTDVTTSEGRKLTAGGNNVTASGKYTTMTYALEALGGYKYVMSDVASVTPMAGLKFAKFNQGGYTETGAAEQNLNISTKLADKVSAVVGARANTTTEMSGIALAPEAHAFMNYDFSAKATKTDVRISGLNQTVTTKGAKPSRMSWNVGAGVMAKSNNMEYGVGYDAHMADKYVGHQGTLKVRVNF